MIRSIYLLLAMVCTACSVQKAEIKTPRFDEQLTRKPADYSNGSIWQASTRSMTEDFKAFQRGDIITIIISETSTASKTANTGTERSSSVSAGIPNLLGIENVGLLKNNMNLAQLINASGDSKFAGTGSTSRQDNLTATISAKVLDVLANGNLQVEGRRNVKVNDEDQEIILTGTVRPVDISPNNTINSIYVADAKISYTGRGVITDRQSPGWLMNILDKVWPF